MMEERKGEWERQLEDVEARVEAEVRRVIAYLNDEVVPEVRRDGARALQRLALELRRLANRMDGVGGSGNGR